MKEIAINIWWFVLGCGGLVTGVLLINYCVVVYARCRQMLRDDLGVVCATREQADRFVRKEEICMKVKLTPSQLKDVFMNYINGVPENNEWIKLEAEPIEERPEWIQEYEDRQIGESPDHIIQDFIRTEIIEKLIDDLDPRFGNANHQHYFNKKAQAIRDKWLGGSK
jgi:hypothetical protein